MKHILKSGLVILFILLVLFGSLTLHTIIQSQNYSRLINYVGIVRGATQRLIKLELNNQPNDELILYLDQILDELETGKGQYGLPLPQDEDYLQELTKLSHMWVETKEVLYNFRNDKEQAPLLMTLSEDYFNQANETVFRADEFATQRTQLLLNGCIVMMIIMLLTWGFIFWAYFKRMLRLENTNQKLSDLARRDTLTGAYNFDAFKEEGQRLLDEKSNRKLAIVYTDFSDFKYINDVFGYHYGDSVLKKYTEIIMEGLQEKELCGRVSADNFVLLLRYEEKEEIALRQQEIDQKITQFMRNSNNRQSVSTCCGICCIGDVLEDLNIDGLLDRANFARKTVKNGANRNYVYYDESIRRRLLEEKNVESRMTEALENHEFTVFYQPKVDLVSGKVAGSEALVRWRSKDGTVIPPDRFIPVFERKRMIDRLDQYVFEEVCRCLRERLNNGKAVIPVSVNVSRLQFYNQNFVKKYTEIRDFYEIPTQLLEIEFTESMAVDNAELLIQIVKQFQQEGFSCSIDDFGKGYSSLSLLKSLPVNTLKIDQFFFAESDDFKRDMAVVEGIIDLVHKFHIKTIAEGVETKCQVEHLQKIGCDFVQGYVYYKPLPKQAYETLLDQSVKIKTAA